MATSLPTPVRQLPSNHVGHLPDLVSDEDQGKSRILAEFEVPKLLTDAQLAEQVGDNKLDFDPLWFLYDPRHLPCFRRAATLGGGIGALVGASVYWRTRAALPSTLGGAATWFAGFALSWAQCRVAYKSQKMHDPNSAMSLVQGTDNEHDKDN